MSSRKEFRFPKNFKKTRNKVALYFHKTLKNEEIEISKLILNLKAILVDKKYLFKEFIDSDINMLYKMSTQHPDAFIKYFSDLAEIIKDLIISSKIHKKIGAFIIIKDIAELLNKRNITLLLSYARFYSSILEIFKYLKSRYKDHFPRLYRAEGSSNENYEEYRRVVTRKLKLYVIKSIYNGKYYINGRLECPDCLIEDLFKSKYIINLESLEFHHEGDEKENKFTAQSLYNFFTKNRSNPQVLNDLISLMESEKVRLVCRNHHQMLHAEIYHYFKYLINWENIHSISAEEIYMLIIISINNFRLTKNYSKRKRLAIRTRIETHLKKKYIIKWYFGEYCHTCGKFNIDKYLCVYQFGHSYRNLKTIEANQLYLTGLSCSEISQKLTREKGGYLCGNCHSIFDYEDVHLLDDLYDDKALSKEIFEEYNRVRSEFKIIHFKGLIGNPFKRSIKIYESTIKYLIAVYEVLNSRREATRKTLTDYLKIDNSTFRKWFRRNKDSIQKYLCTTYKSSQKGSNTIIYDLTNEGKKIASLMIHFRDYYDSLILDECKNCNLNRYGKCLAKKPNQCSIIKEKDLE